MLRRRHVLLIAVLVLIAGVTARTRAQSIPDKLSDLIFWSMSTDASEDDGTFRSDNLLSNELYSLQYVIHSGSYQDRQGRPHLHGCRTGAEFYLHGGAETQNGVHCRHPPRQ